jgi:hypothetical protein
MCARDPRRTALRRVSRREWFDANVSCKPEAAEGATVKLRQQPLSVVIEGGRLGLWFKSHCSFHKFADAGRDGDQKIGRWLLHGKHLDDAFGGPFGLGLAAEVFLCAPSPIVFESAGALDRRHGV